MASLMDLPDEILTLIMKCLPLAARLVIHQTSSRLRQLFAKLTRAPVPLISVYDAKMPVRRADSGKIIMEHVLRTLVLCRQYTENADPVEYARS